MYPTGFHTYGGSRFELLFRKQLLITGGFCPQVGSSVLWLEFLEKG